MISEVNHPLICQIYSNINSSIIINALASPSRDEKYFYLGVLGMRSGHDDLDTVADLTVEITLWYIVSVER